MKNLLVLGCGAAATLATVLFLQGELDKQIADKQIAEVSTRYETVLRETTLANQNAMRRMTDTITSLEDTVDQLHLDYTAKVEAAARAAGSSYTVSHFGITAYSPYDDRNGINSDGNPDVTSVGMAPGPNVFAVDPEVIPYYSTVVIIYRDGRVITGVAGDCGGAIQGNRIDIYRDTFEEALEHGYQEATVVWFE